MILIFLLPTSKTRCLILQQQKTMMQLTTSIQQLCLASSINRGTFLSSIITKPMVLTSLLQSDNPKFNKNEPNSIIPLSIDEALSVIKDDCPSIFLDAVKSSGCRFLYRGEDMNAHGSLANGTREDKSSKTSYDCTWMNPQPDLLTPGTYDDVEALTYFEKLEKYLTEISQSSMRKLAKPSNAHIGTPNIMEASKWGQAVSVWPVGNDFSFCYPRSRKEFFDHSVMKMDLYYNDDIVVNFDLSIALKDDREIMFATRSESGSTSAFVAIPSEYDDLIRLILF